LALIKDTGERINTRTVAITARGSSVATDDATLVAAAKSGDELPAGTWLGSCKTVIGVTTGPHCHVQGWDGPRNVFSGKHALKRDVFLPRLKKG